MNSKPSSSDIKAEALRLGFFACGIAKADKVDESYAKGFLCRIEDHDFADMHYMYENVEKRLDPRLLVPGVKSIVSLALNYTPAKSLDKDRYQIAAYALGKDYHDIMKRKMWQLVANLGLTDGYRCFVDTAPILERYWATKAGIGWIGRNQQLIIPHAGSMFFLGEVFLDFEVSYDSPMKSRCGKCHNCIDNCPTHALTQEDDGKTRLNAQLCLSYQTIENRGQLSDEAKAAMSTSIYGCDRCQTACPWNRFAIPNTTDELQPSEELLAMQNSDWENLTEESYRRLFKGSAVKRTKYTGLTRNIAAVAKPFKEQSNTNEKA